MNFKIFNSPISKKIGFTLLLIVNKGYNDEITTNTNSFIKLILGAYYENHIN